ncbi:MAG TPA: dihydroorotate dehydrogenase electron transfer subunit [Spirochaetota bacterium]|nr:dihydroorotate dehydrogenase electron transfer subunit [Spirochaetota bacterium]HPG49768.1 dihydroorotate dehydrogenase electron transfer subunit [Spirochaetota bacterium]HPN10632.1 dihydroorotate dehydrogenase electron transfer subunit [Spirochaetota bacterium]
MPVLKEKPRAVARDHYLLEIAWDAGESRPGQFVAVRVSEGTDPLLRRPFSIFSRDPGTVSILVRTVGKGTGLLALREPGAIDVIGPLGTGFSILRDARVLLAGGGVGNAPLYYLARELKKTGCDITCIYGARSRDFIYLEDRYREECSRFILTTDDGSAGEKGMVPDAADRLLRDERFDMVYICGPAAMMKATAARAHGSPVEVSVENYFGCGIGICAGCSIETTDGRKRACIDGPVFTGTSVIWDSMPD